MSKEPRTLADAEVDIESWRLAMFALLEHLIEHEMPIAKARAALSVVPTALQRDFGCGGRYYGKEGVVAQLCTDLVNQVGNAVKWRLAMSQRDCTAGAEVAKR